MATTVTFKRPDGQNVQGYLAEPEHASGAAAVVVIQEWWGVNDQIRGVADRLASAGYVALVASEALRYTPVRYTIGTSGARTPVRTWYWNPRRKPTNRPKEAAHGFARAGIVARNKEALTRGGRCPSGWPLASVLQAF